jgi:prepilin-type N-terminal cleavage/methylation domain-containing protein
MTDRLRVPYRSGFSVLEMLVVVTVILLLMALAYPIFNRIRSRADISATTALVQGVMALVGQASHITARDGASLPAWTVGQTTVAGVLVTTEIDGDPSRYPPGDPSPLASRAPAGYHGFLIDTHATFDAPVNAKGQLLDRWRQPLHIAFDPSRFGGGGFGVWSNGPDRQTAYPLDSGASLDDLRSWGGHGE